MGLIISTFRDVNSEYLNIEMYYSYLYFKYQNKEFLKYNFCFKISIYKDRVKNKGFFRDVRASIAVSQNQ